MPRKGANMSKAEAWSLLITINDEMVMLSAALVEIQEMLRGSQLHQKDVEQWQEENARVFSTKIPKKLADRVDLLLTRPEMDRYTRSSLIATLLSDYCDVWEEEE